MKFDLKRTTELYQSSGWLAYRHGVEDGCTADGPNVSCAYLYEKDTSKYPALRELYRDGFEEGSWYRKEFEQSAIVEDKLYVELAVRKPRISVSYALYWEYVQFYVSVQRYESQYSEYYNHKLGDDWKEAAANVMETLHKLKVARAAEEHVVAVLKFAHAAQDELELEGMRLTQSLLNRHILDNYEYLFGVGD